MRKNGKKALSMLLALVMVLGMLPGTAWAAEESGAEAVSPAAEDTQPEESENAQPEAPEELQPDEELEGPQTDEVPDETDSSPTLYDSKVTYAVTGGNLYFYSGEITDCDESVTSADIPSSINGTAVTSIGFEAFSGCTNLTSVTIPSGVTHIRNYAFGDCIGLTSVIIGDDVTYIGKHAFDGCASLTSVTIPDGVTSIGSYAFSECVSLPNIIIPKSVTCIEESVFSYCASLTSVTIPDGVTSIEAFAFCDCVSLPNVFIPDSVTSILSGAFQGCTSLSSISIPFSVTTITGSAFSSCTALTAIQVDAYNQNYVSIDGVLFTKDMRTLVTYPGKKGDTYTIPDNVDIIGFSAFGGCTSLTSVVVPDCVTCIEWHAFDGCASLTSVVIPDSVTRIEPNAFQFCTGLTSVAIGNGVTKIEFQTFAYCEDLNSVTLGTSISLIETYAFSGCRSLTSLTVPTSLLRIKDKAFHNCTNLTDVYYAGNEDEWKEISIEWGMWEGHPFESTTIHYNCMKTGPCGDNVTWSLYGNALTILGTGAMTNYASYMETPWCDDRELITRIIIKDGVTSLGDFCFMAFPNVTSVTIADSVTSIGENVFFGCKALQGISIPNSVSSIGQGSFQGCSVLKHIDIPEGIQTIALSTFHNCEALESVSIPGSVTNVERHAFNNCISLTDVYFYGSQEQWNEASKSNTDSPLLNVTMHFLQGWPVGTLGVRPESGTSINLWNDTELTFSVKFNSKVLPGTGKIYLRNYDTGAIIRTIANVNSLDDPTDSFCCNGQTLTVQFQINYSDGKSIKCDQKYYFTVDADAIHFSGDTKFDGISDKDSWNFSTEFGLSRDSDYFDFINAEDNFFDHHINNENPYPIEAAAYKRKIAGIVGIEKFAWYTRKSEKFGGSCFGISVATALYKMGMLTPANFDWTANTLHDMKKPKDSTEPYGVRDMINYYFLLQLADGYGITGFDTLTANLLRDKDKFADAAKTLVEQGLTMNKSKKPLVLSIGWMEGWNQLQHAVVVCSARKVQDGSYELLIKDPNVGHLSAMSVSADFLSITYFEDYDQHEVIVIKTLDVTTIPPQWLIHGKIVLSSEPSGNPAEASLYSDTQDYDILKVVAYGNFTVTNSSGKTLVLENGYLSGSMDVLYEDFVESGVGDYAEFVYYVPKSDGYTFQSTDSRSSCTVSDGEQYLSVSAENADSITLNKAAGISVQGSDLVYDACATTATGTNMFAISGATGSNLEISLTSDGGAEISADSLENVEFQSLYDDTFFTFDSTTNTAKVVETDQGSLALIGVEVREQTLFSTSLKDAGDHVEATVTNNTADSRTAAVMTAVYQPSGQFIRTDIKELTFEGNQAVTFSLPERDVTFKIFVVNNLDNLVSISNSATFKAGK